MVFKKRTIKGGKLMKKFLTNFKKLYQPFQDSIQGSISVKEVVSAVLLAVVFVLCGGGIQPLVQTLVTYLGANPDLSASIIAGLASLLTALLHKQSQGKILK